MAYGARKQEGPATFADLDALPENVVGEIIDGTLYVHPWPGAAHSDLLAELGTELIGPFHKGRGGPGGWLIHIGPGIRLANAPEFVPDLAGWRRERVPHGLPDGSWTLVPDWACEVLSPSTRAYDQRIKRPFYARIGIRHLWFIDPEARTLSVSELREGHWLELGVYGEDDIIRAAPFDAIELRLGELWPAIATPPKE
ncbi:Uma2 family endonuclease [Pyxidicoccus fallax]|uniref:Uma2 family endonuclease n=1 Tax=Pyxidicoccus fallax TaxID=394095 RepID=A0A848LS00_9BACT|nr:Uma2 family endonuclease [Pyxidicoccus fallax]NMO20402.1 Uma2 family endonuclease [Pyxidicoccus fallax]NPC83143.1 Uma2 family endonuclease [Pyxidicoccus fallax]